MKKVIICIIVLLLTEFLPAQVKRESILDRVFSIDTVLYREVPPVFRWCDSLNLKKQRINTGDCTLYVEEEGSGIPIVLINGGPGGTHHYFHPWFSAAAKYTRIIYYDQRGCGLSDFLSGKEGYSVDQAVYDLEAIRKSLKIDKWILLGYSYGGFLAQYYTTKFPGSMAGLILVGASPNIQGLEGNSRVDMFVTREENARLEKINNDLSSLFKSGLINKEKYTQLIIYNNYLNADWKRQNFYKPSRERAAQMALYEWVHDNNFNSILNNSESRIDLTSAFNKCPIPTLILEGKWDLTWAENKKEALKMNHPGSKMIVFESAAHGIYDEEPDEFFGALKDFISGLPSVDINSLTVYTDYLKTRETEMGARPESIINSLNWGLASSRIIVQKYDRDWLGSLQESTEYLRIGFAHYDMDNYNEALYVFEQMEKKFGSAADSKSLALIWQGHILDLLGRRDDAVVRYKTVSELNLESAIQHGQYGLKFKLSTYAAERIKTPFIKRINSSID